MRLLHFITSCERDRNNGAADVCRNTWLRSWGHLVDFRFIVGRSSVHLRPDELQVDADEEEESESKTEEESNLDTHDEF